LEHAREYGGEARGLFLAGHSAGAYNAVQLALEPSHLRQEGVEPRLISGVVALAGPYDFLPLDVKATIDAFGEWHDLPATQPINHVRRDAPPMLLIHGTRDTVVGPYHTERLARALRRAGARVEEKIYEGADHSGVVLALSRAFRGKASVLDDMVRFLTDLA
jgi:acetyl esterase/lipase